MKPHDVRAGDATSPVAGAAAGEPPYAPPGPAPSAMASRDALRGLADSGPDAPARASAPQPTLWTRIKRAFQYGSQGGESR